MALVRIVTNNGLIVTASSSNSTADSTVGVVTIATTAPITLEDGTTTSPIFTFPYAPNDVSIDGIADEYDQLRRPGRKPLLLRGSAAPLQISISAVVTANRTLGAGTAPVEENLLLLRQIAQAQVDLVITGLLGQLHWGIVFRLTDLRIDATRFNNLQQMTIANVTMQFTEAQVIDQRIPGMIAIADVATSRPPTPSGGSKRRTNSGTKKGATAEELSLWLAVKEPRTIPTKFGSTGSTRFRI
jgi:hypothetical protein